MAKRHFGITKQLAFPEPDHYPPLAAWLHKHNARCLWSVARDSKHVAIEGWLVNNHVVIVEMFAEGKGWNIYTATDDSKIDVTLLDAELRVGLP